MGGSGFPGGAEEAGLALPSELCSRDVKGQRAVVAYYYGRSQRPSGCVQNFQFLALVYPSGNKETEISHFLFTQLRKGAL